MSVNETASTSLVDFHCHLDLYQNHREIIEECERLKVRTLSVTNAPNVWPRNQHLVEECRYVRVALGLHPQLVYQRSKELSLFEEYLPQVRYVGEVGLDGSPEYSHTWELQKKVFRRILELCAQYGGKILTVHSRRAARETIEMINTYLPEDRGRVVLHWFSGTKQEAQLALDAKCYFSINIKTAESTRGRELISSLPYDFILTETDGPFVNSGNTEAHPKDVMKAITGISTVWNISEEMSIKRINNNLKRLLS
jgi:TatD DNase family protein